LQRWLKLNWSLDGPLQSCHFSVDWKSKITPATVFALIFFHLPVLSRKPNLENISIYSNKFLPNFHLSESRFTCPGLRASGLARRLLPWTEFDWLVEKIMETSISLVGIYWQYWQYIVTHLKENLVCILFGWSSAICVLLCQQKIHDDYYCRTYILNI
jgi:hypothetical protein